MNRHIVKLSEYGSDNIGARVIGVNIKNELMEIINKSPDTVIIFDFEGVKYISTGFAKELFGELYRELNGKFKDTIKIKLSEENKIIKDIIIKGIGSILN